MNDIALRGRNGSMLDVEMFGSRYSIPTVILDANGAQITTFPPPSTTRSDTYTGTGNGITVNVSSTPTQTYAVQVVGTGAAATSWDVRVEGSLDNVNFDQILQHTNTIGDKKILFSGASIFPALYIRSRCAALVLGGATNIVVYILGVS